MRVRMGRGYYYLFKIKDCFRNLVNWMELMFKD